MKKSSFFVLFIVLISFTIAAFQTKNTAKKMNTNYVFPKNGSYEKEWKKVDSLQEKGLTRSALAIIAGIYSHAKTERSTPNYIRAIIERMKFESYLEEDEYVKSIADLENEAATAYYPAKQLIYSITAEIYWRYYQNNRWTFLNRTETRQFENKDIRTWDLKKIYEKVSYNYHKSLTQAERSKQITLSTIDALLQKEPGSQKLRPTLYDLLAHRAIDFFMNEESGLIKPANLYAPTGQEYFGSAKDFCQLVAESSDSTSRLLQTVRLLQDVMYFHLKDKDPQALVDVDLKRLKFVKENNSHLEKDSLYLRALRAIEQNYSTHSCSADASFLIASYYWEMSNAQVDKQTSAGLRKKCMSLCEAVLKQFSASDAAKNCSYLKALLNEKELGLTLEDVTIPNKPILGLLRFKNITKAYFKIVKLSASNESDLDRGLTLEMQKSLLKQAGVANWSVTLPQESDYLEHTCQIAIPLLTVGHYILFVGSDPDFSSTKNGLGHSSFWVSNIAYITQRKQDGSYEGYTLNRESGGALSNLSLRMWYETYDQKSRTNKFTLGNSFTSDAQGHFEIPSNENHRNFYLEIEDPKGDRLCSDYGFYHYKNYESPSQPFEQTYFFTDRKIYRPGQTVYFKALLLEKDGDASKILANKQTEITFSDANGQKISSLQLLTNEYGSCHGSFTIPTGRLNGQMYLATQSGSCYFSVEEYKRPKFEVSFDAFKTSYLLGENVTVQGKAISYSGVSLSGANVSYRVVRKAVYPVWWGFMRYFPMNQSEVEIRNGASTTNSEGAFSISFDALPDLTQNNSPDLTFNFLVFASITDINGETHSAEKTITLGNTAYNLSASLPTIVDKEKEVKIKLRASNLNGEYEAAKGTLTVYKLKQATKVYRERRWDLPDLFLMNKSDFEHLFPYDQYADEANKYTWERGEKMEEIAFSTDTTVAKNTAGEVLLRSSKNWEQGEYLYEAISYDKNNKEVKVQNYFTLYSSLDKKATGAELLNFSMLKDAGEPGETAQVLVGTAEKKLALLVELECKNEIIKRDWLELSTSQKIIDIPLEESYRGNCAVHITAIKQNRLLKYTSIITVPYTNRELDIQIETFRNKLKPGETEEWKLKIRDKKGNKTSAELIAAVYDASLDAFAANSWIVNLYQSYYSTRSWDAGASFKLNSLAAYGKDWNIYPTPFNRQYDHLNWFGYEGYGSFGLTRDAYTSDMSVRTMAMPNAGSAAPMAKAEAAMEGVNEQSKPLIQNNTKSKDTPHDAQNSSASKPPMVKLRNNFNETAFFYPQLETNEVGDVLVKFTLPDALTRWKLLGWAHSKDLKTGSITAEFQTQKELMIGLLAPRFFREGDSILLRAKIENMSDQDQQIRGNIRFINTSTQQDITQQLLIKESAEKKCSIQKNGNQVIQWKVKIPQGLETISCLVTANTAGFSDGEEVTIPVLSNKTMVVESLPLSLRGKEQKTFSFPSLLSQNNQSKTLQNYSVTLEFSSNPVWYAIQALPYLMESSTACSEQLFSRYYATSIAAHLANSSPKIKRVFDSWKSAENSGNKESLLSSLEKNTELKTLLLEETPWVMQAKNEHERKQRLGLLFDLNTLSNETEKALNQLLKMQLQNGGWPWFEGMQDDAYITQHVVAGLGHLDHLGIKFIRTDAQLYESIKAAIAYMDTRMREEYDQLLKYSSNTMNENHLSYAAIHYLYSRSYFKEIELSASTKIAFAYYKGQAEKYWLKNNRYLQGMIALSLNRYGSKNVATSILASLKENALISEEFGMYWKDNTAGYYWHQAPIETQALLMEAFDEIANDAQAVEAMKVWLLKNKQCNDWKTTRATTEACYALLRRGTDFLAQENEVEIKIGSYDFNTATFEDSKKEAGTGYFKTSWHGNDIKPDLGSISVKPAATNSSTQSLMWGAVYWNYYEELTKITQSASPLQISKKLFCEKNSPTGPFLEPITPNSLVKPGDKVVVRIEIRSDREMEYVQLKDMRASGLEPISVISTYTYQDGLGYYVSTKDASTNFYFSHIPRGTHVLEYTLRASHSGNFSNGISSIQCAYAPEFTSHSEGVRIEIK